MKKHELKIAPKYYEAVASGLKTFEIRKNDRDFEEGDEIVLREFDGGYTSNPILSAKISYVTDYAQQDGYVVFAFTNLKTIHGDLEYIKSLEFEVIELRKVKQAFDRMVEGTVH